MLEPAPAALEMVEPFCLIVGDMHPDLFTVDELLHIHRLFVISAGGIRF
jgi:hypothetical protein